MKKFLIIPAALASFSVAGYLWSQQDQTPFTGQGNVDTLSSVYQRWKQAYEQQGHTEIVKISLNYSKARSQELTAASAQAILNLKTGQLQVAAQGLPAQQSFDVWMLNHHQAGEKEIKIGQLTVAGENQTLVTLLDAQKLNGFTLDSMVIVKAGADPQHGGLLFGSPGLLQRIYYTERYWPVVNIGGTTENGLAKAAMPFDFLLPKMAQAAKGKAAVSTADQLADLISRGEQIFTQETFNGNGRTCATCHRPDNNHTIDPAYIAKLPKRDPLFVAEYRPALAQLENSRLLRQFGLILANVDGFDKPGVMRSPSHLLGLSVSLKFETMAMGGEFQEDTNYFNERDLIAQQTNRNTEAIGWSGDGAPDGGSLRDFARGAVVQHMPNTLNRVENTDFRMPTEDELDALEAYMLSLGRSEDINLANMTFKSPLVQKGLLLFNTKQNPGEILKNGIPVGGAPVFGTTANCNGCHMNAGAISSSTGGNPTRDTGVERMRDQLHHLVDANVSYDGGFGQTLQNDCGPNFDQTCYSDGSADPRGVRPAEHPRLNRFNTPSLIEAADTGPFFHNNSVTTLEETIAYYNTEAFNNSPGAFTSKGVNRQVKLDSSQVIAVGMFLRSINVLENIRSSNVLDQKAIGLRGKSSNKTLLLAIADTEDAIQVLTEAVINPYPEALEKLKAAFELENKALSSISIGNRRQKLLEQAITLKNQAKALMVTES